MLSDSTSKSTFQRNTDPNSYRRPNGPMVQNSPPPFAEQGWKNSSAPQQMNTEYWKNSQTNGSQYATNQYPANVLQTTAIFHERESKLEKVNFNIPSRLFWFKNFF